MGHGSCKIEKQIQLCFPFWLFCLGELDKNLIQGKCQFYWIYEAVILCINYRFIKYWPNGPMCGVSLLKTSPHLNHSLLLFIIISIYDIYTGCICIWPYVYCIRVCVCVSPVSSFSPSKVQWIHSFFCLCFVCLKK